ncbi:putative ATP-grasp-modified RiPP [Streptomyces sp. NPDC006476]|uniref:putative ATP-grasp-modified RiPP n=1 Tax=Streptomyces sp. NPDC006476 TaxID=3157175 RepID=UPI0033A65F60
MHQFALNYSRPIQRAEESAPYIYDPELQLNLLSDGNPAAHDHALLRELSTTTSTAGSKTHFDD